MKIIIVDDHEMILESLSMLLGSIPDVEIVGTFSDPEKVEDYISNYPVDIVVTDYDMPEMTGLELTFKIRAVSSKIKILMLTVSEEVGVIKDAFKAGVSGYVMKKATRAELQSALSTIYSGKRFFSESVIFELLNPDTSTGEIMETDNCQSVALSSRELEIIKLISNEFSSVEIAEKLFISPATVETHRHNIMKKLDVHNSVGVVKYAIQSGLLD